MSKDLYIKELSEFLEASLADEPGVFLVDLDIRPTHNFKVYLDADQGLSIAACAGWNRKIRAWIEEKNWFPEGDFSLEVSSPGLDEPLRLRRQYLKNIGRQVETVLTDGSKYKGKLLQADEQGILLEVETGKGKKKEIRQHQVPFSDIKTTTIQIVF